jgi:A/G-specific adenine glycosylase
MNNQSSFASKLLDWYDTHGRTELPWRQNITPYRVWVSEIMLQQTQVNTVLPYFRRFESHFPDIITLARASLDEVLHLWTGLGYYARGRNLHKTANIICSELDGEFPQTTSDLLELPGIGRSTAGAICAIAYNQPTAILDGNVKRVLARYHTIDGWPGQTSIQKHLWQLAESATPDERCADYTQGIMDLGATICMRSQPKCSVCPVQDNCRARATGTTDQYPASKPKKKLPIRRTYFLIMLDSQGRTLLQQRPPAGLWGGLWSFPECETKEAIRKVCRSVGVDLLRGDDDDCQQTNGYPTGATQRHTFSHYHLDYTPIYINYINVLPQSKIAEDNILWVETDKPGKLGLPRPIQKLLESMTPGNGLYRRSQSD